MARARNEVKVNVNLRYTRGFSRQSEIEKHNEKLKAMTFDALNSQQIPADFHVSNK